MAQDFLLSVLAIRISNAPVTAEHLVWRGGTCLHKLHLERPWRYSEDLDYVLLGDIEHGTISDAITSVLTELGMQTVKAEISPSRVNVWASAGIDALPGSEPVRVKLEVNRTDAPPALELIRIRHQVRTRVWHEEGEILTFQPAELIGTKFRALAQRRKGRDLSDLWLARRELAIQDVALATGVASRGRRTARTARTLPSRPLSRFLSVRVPHPHSHPMKILLVDDDPGFRRALTLILEDAGYDVRTASDGVEGLERARRERPHLVLTDVRMPRMGGMDLVDRLREEGVEAPVIVMTAYGSMDLAVEALRRGAADYLAKPFGAPEALLALRKVEARFHLHSGGDATSSAGAEGTAGGAAASGSSASPERTAGEGPASEDPTARTADGARVFGALHVRSDAMIRVGETARKVAGHPTSVLIQGPTGTGKELLARFLHDASPRSGAPFVPVNCAAIPANLLESEFFGVKRGAYTGAERDRPGLFEAASGGTLFLDEVGELPEALQVKLLRVLQEGVVRRLGGDAETPVDVRIVAATNRDLEEEIGAGRFREDLYYRLAVVTLAVPPLSERPEDLELLVDHLLARHARRLGMAVPPVSEAAREALRVHPWPGNVRELENVLERALILAGEGGIGVEALPWGEDGAGAEEPAATDEAPAPGALPPPPADLSVKRRGAELERELIREALARTGGHRGQAAELLELSDRALRYKIREYGLDGAEDEEGGAGEEVAEGGEGGAGEG